MKAIYLIGSVLLTGLIMIIAFGNINSACNDIYFFFKLLGNISPTILILISAVIGIITGMLYHAFISKIGESGSEDEEDI